MEIPMSDIIDSYRQKLSDVVHQIVLKELHIQQLEKTLEAKTKEIENLRLELDFIKLAEEDLSNEPDDWGEEQNNGNRDST